MASSKKFIMSATNTAANSPNPSEAKDPPSSARQELSKRFSLSVAISSPDATGQTIDATATRRELLGVLMDPNADKEKVTEFAHKLIQYNRVAGPLGSDDILWKLATHCFGMQSYKLVVIGSGGVGKSAFVQKHLNNKFLKEYKATNGAEVTSLVFLTDDLQLLKFDVWDTAGCEKPGSLRDGYYVGADGAVLMYDQSRASQKSLPGLLQDLSRVRENIPIVVVGNKVDVKTDGKSKPKQVGQVKFARKHRLPHFDLSVKSGYQVSKPLLHLAKELLGNRRLSFLSADAQASDKCETANPKSQLSSLPVNNQADVDEAKRLSLPPSNDEDGGL